MMGPLAYIGGKRRLAKRLIPLLAPHTTYVEPFAGGAQVFFAKEKSPIEVINDLDGEVVNFFRVCQWHHEELVRSLRFMVISRRLFELLKHQDPSHLTDVQRAARFLYLQKNCFGGKVEGTGQNFHTCITKPPNYNLERLPALIEATAERLTRVQLENRPYASILDGYDRESTLFYLDPPYVGVKLYKFNFSDADFHELARRLSNISGKFLLSINDHPVAREAFAPFYRTKVSVAYTVSQAVPTVKELVFANYELPRQDGANTASILDTGDVLEAIA